MVNPITILPYTALDPGTKERVLTLAKLKKEVVDEQTSFVATKGADILGYLLIDSTKYWIDLRFNKNTLVPMKKFHVIKNYRRRGIGMELMLDTLSCLRCIGMDLYFEFPDKPALHQFFSYFNVTQSYHVTILRESCYRNLISNQFKKI